MEDDEAEPAAQLTPMAGPLEAHWNDVIEDLEATADEYDDRGWETLVLRPGDVTPLAGEDVERPGFDVLLPDDEFVALLETVDGSTFDEYEAYSSVEEGVAFLLIVMRDEAAETAVLFPAYYRVDDDAVDELRDRAEETGVVKSHLRRLREDRIVTFEHDEPEHLFADEE